MKIKVTIAGNEQVALILSVENAGLAAQLLSRATVYERDGYYSTSGWKKAEQGIRIEYTEGTELEPTHPLVEKAQKEASDKNSQWYAEYQKNQALQKQVAELSEQLEAIKTLTTCTVTEPEPIPADEVEGTEVQL